MAVWILTQMKRWGLPQGRRRLQESRRAGFPRDRREEVHGPDRDEGAGGELRRFKVMGKEFDRVRTGQVPRELRHQEGLVDVCRLDQVGAAVRPFLRHPGGYLHLATQPRARARRVAGRIRQNCSVRVRKNPRASPRRRRSAKRSSRICPSLSTTAPNDKGIGIQLAHSLARVGVGYLLAILLAGAARLRRRHVARELPGARSLYPDPQAHLAPRVDADRPLHHQGLVDLGRVRDFHSARSGRC